MLSTIDIHCNTIEIPYKKAFTNRSYLDKRPSQRQFIKAIENIYLYINDIPYIEEDEKTMLEVIHEKIQSFRWKELLAQASNSLRIIRKNNYKFKSS
ncbi:hypothetical protein SDC9_159111 [bioreactor metagenome]|uniref:Uncharacterized protein n=1 Tax=bioreactor metagenome TaxID=1076179 RepID=A0A645FHS9_9ZZZZ